MPTSRAKNEREKNSGKLPVAIIDTAAGAKKACRENGKGFQVMGGKTNPLRTDNREIKKMAGKLLRLLERRWVGLRQR